MFVRNCVWSGLLCSFCDIEHVVFEYLTVFFGLLLALNRQTVITSQVPVLLSCRYLVRVQL